ncbi:sugar ABC transporter substrate-binding protein [bacterium]|nr:sugar ABC transporter substrate-binding protein [bacterium]MDY3023034.1 sugar ABC transporter substrate-binding protein [Oliverpabstia sp.]
MFKKLLAMGIALTMGVSMMTGCSVVSDGSSSNAKESSSEAEDTADAAENTDEAEADTAGQKIALFMTHMSNEFTVTLSSAVEAEVKSRGYDYSVYDAGQDAATQADQIEQAITLGVNGIIIEPVSVDGIVPSVKAAKEAGVKVVIVNQRISEPEAADCYVGADAATTGAKLMEEVMKDINAEGNIALLLGPMGSDGQIGRSAGFDQVLAENPNVEVVFQDTAEWQTEPALTIVENWLNAGKEIKAIVAQNDGMAVGAAKAVADAQKTGEIKVYGVDATSEGLQGVLDGNLQGTI